MSRCLIGLGSNSGDRAWHLDEALRRLAANARLQLLRKSTWRETQPIGGPVGQNRYLNGAVILDTSLGPHELLQLLNEVESQLGRRRARRWDARTIDLDLLLYDDLVLSATDLQLPHPRMAWRRFVLEPAAEIAGEMRHPTVGWTIARLLEHLDTARPYVAVSGPIGAGKTVLAEGLCRAMSARFIAEALDERRLEHFYGDTAAQAWAMELGFLEQRKQLLSPAEGEDGWAENCLAVSDFWFDQSAAFARVWLAPDQFVEFARRFAEIQRSVARPKLLVLLDAPTDELLARINRRGRRGETSLTIEQIERIRQSIFGQAALPDVGPVLRIASLGPEEPLAEAIAAIESMV
jgi:2-amino-4-hydroxy-6-hydroxymethyldihydropteridine diphosphokinase